MNCASYFQLTESVQDSGYFGPTKMRFTPFMRVEHQGSFMTVVVRGLEAVSVQLGISSLSVDPVGMCICGIADIQEVKRLPLCIILALDFDLLGFYFTDFFMTLNNTVR